PTEIPTVADPSCVGASLQWHRADQGHRVGLADPIPRSGRATSCGEVWGKAVAKTHTRKDPSALIDAIFDALGEQTVTVPGTEARSRWCRGTPPGSKPSRLSVWRSRLKLRSWLIRSLFFRS